MKYSILIIIVIVSLTACASNSGDALTLEANHALAGTQIADLRITATVQAARAETTLDFMGTRASLGATQSVFLEETLIATGFAPDALATRRQQILGSSPTPLPTLTPNPEETQDLMSTSAPTSSPTVPGVTRNAPNPTPAPQVQATINPNGLYFGTIVTATSAGDDGCGEGITSTFGMGTSEIYVIAPTFNITANTNTFGARWQRNGETVGPVYTFTPNYNADELCIWFFVDETDFEFIPGSYSVTIEVDGQAATNPVPFVIQ